MRLDASPSAGRLIPAMREEGFPVSAILESEAIREADRQKNPAVVISR